jgi:uncharacterized membrane protein YgcG
LLLSHTTLAHRKMTVALFALLFLLGGALTACSSSGSGALTGTVASINSASSSFTLTPQQATANAASVTVHVNPQTAFRGALHGLSDLAVGMLVKVQGSAASNAFTATQVEDQDQNDDHGKDDQRDEFKGTVGAIHLATPSFDLKLADGSTRLVTTDAQTEFEGTLRQFTDLATGQRVEVKGAVQADTSILASSVEGENEDEENENNEDAHEIEGTGPVLSLGSNSFVMELNQRQVTVTVATTTEFDGGLHSLADLKVGMHVEIRGALQSNGAIAASRVHGEDNHDGDGQGGDGGGDDHGGGSGSGDGSSGHGGSDDPVSHQ